MRPHRFGSIKLYRSNRTDRLLDQLAELLARQPTRPLQPEWIVVPGRGMAVWLGQQLAARFGIWGGAELVYPRTLVERAYASVVDDVGEQLARYAPEPLSWAVFAALGSTASRPEMGRLDAYLEQDDGGRRRLGLAQTIAATFDRYLAYRPDMLRAWQQHRDELAQSERWQPILWRALCERLGPGHLATLEEQALAALLSPAAAPRGLPSRLVVFGLATLPPMYVRCLAALARHLELHMFLPSVARGYWGDAWGRRRQDELASDEMADHPLIASLGRLGADMQRVLSDELEHLGVAEQEPAGELFVDPGSTTVLQRLQSDLLDARPVQHLAAAGDSSLAIHACHSAMREVEVLHDQLLALLTVGGDLAPEDCVVMLADVETYAPLVEAVFNRDRHDRRFLPFHIADRSLRNDSALLDALNGTIDLVGARLSASQLLDLVHREPIRSKLALSREDIDTITEWVIKSGVRWAIDGEHRAEHEQPALDQNTWRFGLRRLLLGYAMPAARRDTFAGVLPYDEMEGQQTAVLGRFALFCEWLFDQLAALEQPRTLEAWQQTLLEMMDALFGAGPDVELAMQPIASGLQQLVAAANTAGMHEPVSVQVMRDALMALVDDRRAARGFMAGGVTFCAMVPMRNIPFEVVCLVGMSDSDFPRRHGRIDFDLMTKPGAQRPGDRNRRDDDRFLFLEALVATKRRLLITYTGHSIRDNSSLPPSVVVSELLEYLENSQPATVGRLVTHHPLQPFSPRYFDDEHRGLFSYADDLCRGAAFVGQRGAAPASFFGAPLAPAPPAELLQLRDMVQYFTSPVKYMLRDRLAIDLRQQDTEVADREPIVLDPLERYQLGSELLDLLLAGQSNAQTLALTAASGLLPAGPMGALVHAEELATAQRIAQRTLAFLAGRQPQSVTVELALVDGAVLGGELVGCLPEGLLQYQFSRIDSRHLAAFWLRHLALCAVAQRPPEGSLLVGRGEAGGPPVVAFAVRHCTDALAQLSTLASIYREGQDVALPLFIRPAQHYVQALLAGKTEQDARSSAVHKLATLYDNDPSLAPYLQHAYPDKDALLAQVEHDDPSRLSFVQLARSLFEPLLNHLTEL